MISRRRAGVLLVALAGLSALGVSTAGCKKPQPPRFVPLSAKIVKIDLLGVDLRVVFDAYNPNAFDLAVRKVTARVWIDGKHDLGTVVVDQPIRLPAQQKAQIEVPLSVKWNGAGTLGAIGAAQRAVPYTVDGTANVGGESLNLDVPFAVSGVITQEQLMSAALRSLPALPGLPPGVAPPPK